MVNWRIILRDLCLQRDRVIKIRANRCFINLCPWKCVLIKCPIKFGKGVDFAKRALHIIFFKSFRYHAVPSFNMSNILPFQTICSFMHDFVNNLTPPNVSELFNCSSEKHHYYTRSSAAGNLYLNIWEQNIWKILFQDWVQGSGIVFPSVFVLQLSMNSKDFCKTATKHFDTWGYLCWRPHYNWQI